MANVNRDEHDFWVRTPSGRLLTVQVKTAATVRQGKFCFYLGNIGQNTDIIALVALHPEVVVVCPANQMLQRWPVSDFTQERMLASIKEHLA